MPPISINIILGQVEIVEREISNLIITVGAPAAIILGCIYLAILIVRSYSDNSRVDNQVVLTVIDLLKTGLGSIETAIRQGNIESAKSTAALSSLETTLKVFQGNITDLEGKSDNAAIAIAEHDRIAQSYMKDSSSREQETLDIVRALPEQINAVAELFRKDALQKLQDAQDHIDRQFEAARISINTSFTNMTAALVQAQPIVNATEPTKDPAITEREAIGELVASINATPEPPIVPGESRADVVPMPTEGRDVTL